jgi:G:T-mismatch repair DNA endonuclease (very short patch repair protein)
MGVFNSTLDLLKFYNIPKRSHSEARKTKATIKRLENSLKKKYGNEITNISQIKAVKDKKKQTFLKNYGVDNIWKSKKYCDWLNDYMIINYGVKRIHGDNSWGWKNLKNFEKEKRIEKLWLGRDGWWSSLNDEEKCEIIVKLSKSSSTIKCSKIETKVGDALNRLHIGYKKWYNIGRKIFDFKIEKTNILIEVNGDFWHANPKLFSSNDLVNFPTKPVLAKEIWEKDKHKQLIAEQKGYKVIYIWESELNKMSNMELDMWIEKIL